MSAYKGKIISGGRVVIPADVRAKLGLKEGDTVSFTVDEDSVRIRSYQASTARIQKLLEPYQPKDGTFLSDELIRERREEARREARGE
jgi:AbrB family looped-hinge helix DNA binding protein